MKTFPKKYKPQELKNYSKLYKSSQNNTDDTEHIYNINQLSTNRKIDCSDFFLMYIKDFYTLHNFWKNHSSNVKNLFIFSHDNIQNLNLTHKFFDKKRQTLSQIWIHKLENYINSQENKKIIANNKIVESYFSNPYKIYITDSEFYLYILTIFHSLREKWKFSSKSNIWYRSFNLQTSIPQDHIERKSEKRPTYILKYFVWSKCEALPVCVQDIDLCCWDVALLVHPKDKRYNKYIWKNVIIPLCNRQIPIIWDENVNITLNNGIQRICPCSDQESIQLAKKYWLSTDIFVFDKKWFYTNYIHEPAFIWQNRNKYYENIIWFLTDIWNLDSKDISYEEIKIPYLKNSNEQLVPYKMEQLVLNLNDEKNSIIQQFLDEKIYFSSFEKNYSNIFKEIKNLKQQLNWLEIQTNNITDSSESETIKKEIEELSNKINDLESPILQQFDNLLPNEFICNSQLPFWWKIPLIKNDDWNLSFWNLEEIFKTRKWNDLQKCFDFVLLSLIREWILWKKEFWYENINSWKLCEYDKIFVILSENETKIHKLIEILERTTWKNAEHDKFIKIIQNLIDDENSSINDCSRLIENSNFIKINENRLYIQNIDWIYNEVFDTNFIQYCITCYLESKNFKTNPECIIDKSKEKEFFHELIFQQLILWKIIPNKILEYSYDKENEKICSSEQLSKLQIEQSQRNLFSSLWENPIRLCLLSNYTYDEQEILLNNIFLKQIRNAVRLCAQKWFLPKETKEFLNNNPNDFDDLDLSVLSKLSDLYSDWTNIETFEEYITFFKIFKSASQDLFFSRYLEAEKIFTTQNVQFVCTYFFNFLFNILYPLIPQYIEALIYTFNETTEWNFTIEDIKPIQFSKTADYNINILYDTFIKIKHARFDLNIKQHESFNLFFKSTPSLLDNFSKYEQIFKNYFHISDIIYIRLHEPNPLWYEVISDDILSIGIQPLQQHTNNENSVEYLEKELKDLKDKADLIRERMQRITDSKQLDEEKAKYEKIKEEMDNLTIQIALLE